MGQPAAERSRFAPESTDEKPSRAHAFLQGRDTLSKPPVSFILRRFPTNRPPKKARGAAEGTECEYNATLGWIKTASASCGQYVYSTMNKYIGILSPAP